MIRMAEVASVFMPSLDVPCSMCVDLDNYDVGKRIRGLMTYEVVSKDAQGIMIKVKSISLDSKKRVV